MNHIQDFKHKIAFIIPTRNRHELLSRLLYSIQAQTVKPNQVIVVDGSDQSIEPKIKQSLSSSISYVRVYPPSLTKQRNAGLKALNDDVTLVGYLDDDIILEKDAVEAMLRFWEHCSEDVGGTSFNITNNPTERNPVEKIIKKLFCIDNGKGGAVLCSGYNTLLSPVLKDTYTEWLCGGATVWRRQVIEDFKYDEWFAGWAFIEDVDFSFRVAQKYRLVVLFDARVQHNPPPYNPKKRYSFGKMNVIYRYYFINKQANFSTPLFYLATTGEILLHIIGGLFKLRLDAIRLGFGYAAGLFHIVRKELIQIDENFRI